MGDHISDKKIIQECGLIDLLESGDMVMSERGFDIQHLLPSKCDLELTHFLRGYEQLH